MNIATMNILTDTNTAASSAKVATALMPKSTQTKDTGGASGSTSSSSAATATITSNDFLTLLVSELKNQDPTQPTDPNAYIQQLVGVNSLQQLIQINQGLTNLESTGNTSSSASSTAV